MSSYKNRTKQMVRQHQERNQQQREYERQVRLERWARRLYETDADPEEDCDDGPEEKEF